MKSRLTFVATLLNLAAAPALGQTIYNLDTFFGITIGFGVNSGGQVAGYSRTITNVSHAFRYDGLPVSGGVMLDLGTLGGSDSQAFGINSSGQVTGYSYTGVGQEQHAFRYDGTPGAGGVMLDLGTLGGTGSYGHAVNASGQIAGYSYTMGVGTPRAFRYDGTPGVDGIMHNLGSLGGNGSYAYGINDSGQVAGYSQIPNGFGHAFRYDGTPGGDGVMRDLGTLGGWHSYGRAINDAGQVVGQSYTTNNLAFHAFLYTGTPGMGGSMVDLGSLGGESNALAINTSGQIAGRSTGGETIVHAFIYKGTPGVDGQMIDLDVWLDANYPTEGAKWTLVEANGLSDNGWVTGYGAYNDGPGGLTDGTRAFLLNAAALLEVCPGPADGNMNGDTQVDGLDISPFIAAVIAQSTTLTDVCHGDFNANGSMDADDVPGFVDVLVAN